jgi:NAD(P)H-nitrite reductase large subunit
MFLALSRSIAEGVRDQIVIPHRHRDWRRRPSASVAHASEIGARSAEVSQQLKGGIVSPSLIRELTRRVQAEYAEMPCLSVTLAQARRLLGIDEQTCTAVFDALVNRGVLRRTAQGRYIRV